MAPTVYRPRSSDRTVERVEIGGSADVFDRVSGRRVLGLVGRGLARTAAATAVVLAVVAFVAGAIDFDRAALAERFLGADPTEPLTVEERRRVENLALRNTVTVAAINCRGRSVGSGFGVDGLVLTNRHIVLDASIVSVASAGIERRLSAMVPDPGLDLAVVDGAIEAVEGDPLTLAASEAPVGSPVIVSGRGDGRSRVVDARVHTYTSGRPYGIDGDVMLLDRAVVPGWSGGPVLDRRGRVVGMVQAVDTVTGLTLVVPVERFRSAAEPGWPPATLRGMTRITTLGQATQCNPN